MLPKIVFVVYGVLLFALCKASDNLVNTRRSRNVPTPSASSSSSTSTSTTAAGLDTIPPEYPTDYPTIKPIENNDDEEEEFNVYKIGHREYFDWRLLAQILTTTNTNAIISPFSIKLVLGLLSEGANEETKTKRELSSAFYHPNPSHSIRGYFQKALNSLNAPSEEYTLNAGTKLFISNHLKINKTYENDINQYFYTDVQPLNFAESEKSSNIINEWCSNVTAGHLKDLVSSDTVENAVILLINAVYFDGIWRSPFTQTFEGVFFRLPSEKIRTKYIAVEDKFYFSQSIAWNAKVLRLPYKGNKFSMMVILPNAKGGLDTLIREIEGDTLRRIQWTMKRQLVKVTMPKFKFDFKSELKPHLQELGVREIFGESAELTRIVEGSKLDKTLKVTDIIQKAGIELHETGTTAFAATDVEIVNKFGGDTTEEFNANRPFVFVILDETTNTLLFAGKVIDPTV